MNWYSIEIELNYRKMELKRISQGKKGEGVDSDNQQKKNGYFKKLVNSLKYRLLPWTGNENRTGHPPLEKNK